MQRALRQSSQSHAGASAPRGLGKIRGPPTCGALHGPHPQHITWQSIRRSHTQRAAAADFPATAPAAAAASSSLEDKQRQQQQHRQYVIQETKNFLEQDLQKLFETGNITESRYAKNIVFEDPITQYSTLDGYLFMIRALRTAFNINFDLHSMEIAGPEELVARWTMTMRAWFLPWRPNLLFTGRSHYKVDPDTGIILSHRDVWDAIQNNKYLSIEGLTYVLRQVLDVQVTPELETPDYVVLKATKEYEIRRYKPYLVAEVPMAPGSGPAGGSGFTELAGYIFGSNSQGLRMEMTTPVFTRSGTSDAPAPSSSGRVTPVLGDASMNRMQFMLEKRFKDVELLPEPVDARIRKKQQEGSYAAAARFSGWPLDFEVVAAEKALRVALLKDGLNPGMGYTLARYNEPTVPPQLRRNEVLIDLEDYSWP